MQRGDMAVQRLFTAAELERMSDSEHFELVQGRLVPVTPAGDRHGHFAVVLAARLHAHVRERRLGRVRAETGFVLSRNPDTVRGPDISFVAAGRPAGDYARHGFASGAPDLAVEIISPTNTRAKSADKVGEYLSAGGRMIWVADTDEGIVEVHRPGRATYVVNRDGHLDGHDVVPGFMCRLDELLAELDD